MSEDYILYAEYGYIETPIIGHHIIKFDGDKDKLPKQLLGLTDAPPSPTRSWLNSIGCAPLDDWFCLWWSTPDNNHRRAGVVKSRVALWPLNKTDEIGDISLILKNLGCLESIPDIPEYQIEIIISELITSENPLVYTDVESWPSLLNQLWKVLWPEARKNFSVQMAFMPEHVSKALGTWIYCVPESKKGLWHNDKFKKIDTDQKLSDKMTEHLIYKKEGSTLHAYFNEFITPLNHPSQLKKIKRAAEYYDNFTSSPSFSNSLSLLRSLNSVQITSSSLDPIKNNCIEEIDKKIMDEDLISIMSISNIDLSFSLNTCQIKNLKKWFTHKIPSLDFPDIKRIFEKLNEGSAQKWWQKMLMDSITEQVLKSSPRWNEFLIKILIEKETSEKIQYLIPSIMEHQLISAWKYEQPYHPLENLIRICRENRWSNLHAKCMVKGYNILEAINQQMSFFGEDGLQIIISDSPGEKITQAVIETRKNSLTNLLSYRTLEEPNLLNNLNILEPEWLNLWILHMEKGGSLCPPSLDMKELTYSLFDSLVNKKNVEKINEIISKQPIQVASYALTYESRKNLWQHLDPVNTKFMCDEISRTLMKTINEIHFQEPEEPLRQNIINSASSGSRRISDRGVLNLMKWKGIPEQQAKQLLIKNEWKNSSREIGAIVLSKRWINIAQYIYSLYSDQPDLYIAVHQIKSLLSRKKKLVIDILDAFRGRGHKNQPFAELNPHDLIACIADIAANLAPSRIEAIWIKAGGEQKKLKNNMRADDAWLDAIKTAYETEKPSLNEIVDTLLDDFPNNNELKAVRQQLAHFKKSQL